MQYKKQSWIKLSDIYPQYGAPGIVVYIKIIPLCFFIYSRCSSMICRNSSAAGLSKDFFQATAHVMA